MATITRVTEPTWYEIDTLRDTTSLPWGYGVPNADGSFFPLAFVERKKNGQWHWRTQGNLPTSWMHGWGIEPSRVTAQDAAYSYLLHLKFMLSDTEGGWQYLWQP